MYDLIIAKVQDARHDWELARTRNMSHRTFDEKAQVLEFKSEEAWNRYAGMVELAHTLGVNI